MEVHESSSTFRQHSSAFRQNSFNISRHFSWNQFLKTMHSKFTETKTMYSHFFLSCDHAYWDLGLGGTHRMLIWQRMLIRIRPRRAPIACCTNAWLLKKMYFLNFFAKMSKNWNTCGRHAFVGLRSPIIVFLGQKSETPKTQVAQVTGQKEIMPRLLQVATEA